MSVTPMSNETFELRFEGCGHTMKVSLQHNADDEKCYVCHPELRDVPAPGKCPACVSAAKIQEQGRIKSNAPKLASIKKVYLKQHHSARLGSRWWLASHPR